jgi:hypothetical protein
MKYLWGLIFMVLPLSQAASEPKSAEPRLPEFTMTYSVQWRGIGLGDAIYTLRPANGRDCYVYRSVTDPVGMVRVFYGRPEETSEFCVRGGKVVPKRFSFVRSKSSADNFTLEFDVAAGEVRGGQPPVRELPPDAQDRFGLQQAVRLWVLANLDKPEPGTVDVPMVEDDRIKVYRFAITGRETVEIPAGRFETVLVQRVDDPKKTLKFWLATEMHYLPVRVQSLRGGKSDLHVQLKAQAP